SCRGAPVSRLRAGAAPAYTRGRGRAQGERGLSTRPREHRLVSRFAVFAAIGLLVACSAATPTPPPSARPTASSAPTILGSEAPPPSAAPGPSDTPGPAQTPRPAAPTAVELIQADLDA